MAPIEARVEAQAKLNLFLRVLAREDSGYHQIETLFCRIALADTVRVRITSSGRGIDCTGARVPPQGLGPPEQNLAWRAAASYAAATGFPNGCEISIEKRIPVGGGLGGGSADAGAVLRALNVLNPRPVSGADLLRLAISLGADVPFLTQDESPLALGWGRGERLVLLPSLPPSAAWLLVPEAAVSSADAYRWLDESSRQVSSETIHIEQLRTWDGVAGLASNDFEGPVGDRFPIIGRLLTNLRRDEVRSVLGTAAIVQMTGSGSCVAVVTGDRRPSHFSAFPSFGPVEVLETETSDFVEPVVLTH